METVMELDDKCRFLYDKWKKQYGDSEKSRLMTKRFNAVSQELGMTEEVLAGHVYDMSNARDVDIMEIVEEVCENGNVVLEWIDSVDSLKDEVRHSDLSRSTKYMLLKRPVWEIRKALDSVRKVGSRNIADVPLRLINSNQSTQLFADDFIGKVVFSALCSLLEKGHTRITFSDLWRVLHQSNRWNNEPDKKGFAEAVKGIVGRLDGLLQEFESEKRTLFCVDDDGITIIHKPALWKDAGKNKILIRREMLHVRCQLHWLQRIYVAMRMEQSRRFPNMDERINPSTLEKTTGVAVDKGRLDGYMRKMVACGVVKVFGFDKKTDALCWENAQKQPSEPRKGSDHIDMPEDGKSGSESKQTPEETTI